MKLAFSVDLTLVLAIWGALLSTLLGLLKFAEYRKDRPIIKVSIKPGFKAISESTVYGSMTVLMINVVNKGRRPVSITHTSMMLPRSDARRNLMCLDPYSAKYPVELAESKYHDFILNEDKLKGEYKLTPDKYVAFVGDSTDRTYYSHNFVARFWKLRRIW